MPDGLFDDPQVIIVLVVMIIAGARWVIEQFKKTRSGDGEESEEPPPLAEFEDLYEEARREILERQGRLYPDEEELAEKLEEYSGRPTFQPEVVVPPASAPPPLPSAPPVRRTAVVPSFSAPPARSQLSAAEKAALQRVQSRGIRTTRPAGQPRARSKVRDLLSSPAATRDAIVLREILGPAKGSE